MRQQDSINAAKTTVYYLCSLSKLLLKVMIIVDRDRRFWLEIELIDTTGNSASEAVDSIDREIFPSLKRALKGVRTCWFKILMS